MSSESTTLDEALRRTILQRPDAGITFVEREGGRSFVTYADLYAAALQRLGGLQAAGTAPHAVIVLQLSCTRSYLETLWACILGRYRCVNVARAPMYDRKNHMTDKLHAVWQSLGQPLIVTDRAWHEDVRAAFELYDSMPRVLVLGEGTTQRAGEPARLESADVAFIQLTSGSTGTPKAIQMTHRGILAHVRGTQLHAGSEEREVTLNWMAMDHVGAVVAYHLNDCVLGCHQLHVNMDYILADPLRWLDLMHEYRVTHSWSPNFGYKLLSDALTPAAAHGRTWDLSCVRRLMNGGEQVTMPVMRSLVRALQPYGATERVVQPVFGMAEACTCVTYNNTFTLETGELQVRVGGVGSALDDPHSPQRSVVDLGPPIPGVELRIADAQHQDLGQDVVGKLQIRGAVVTPGYLEQPQANAAAFVGDGWFDSGDLGFLREGRLFVVGRQSEKLVIRGANLASYEVEACVAGCVGVSQHRVVATSVPDEGEGSEQLVLFFVPDSCYLAGCTEAQIRQRVTTAFGIAPRAVVAVASDELATTTSGKLQRERMRSAYLSGALRPKLGSGTLVAWSWTAQTASPVDPASLSTRHGIVLGTPACDAARLPFGTRWLVEAGTQYARTERGHVVDPQSAHDFEQLFVALRTQLGSGLPTLIWAWDFGQSDAWLGCAVALLRGLSRSGLRIAQWLIVGEHLLRHAPHDAVRVQAEVATSYLLAGSAELHAARARVIDLSGCEPAERMRALLAEVCDTGAVCQAVYRAGRRYAGQMRSLWLDNSCLFERDVPWLGDGWILVSGGTGGLGRVLVKRLLAARPSARVLTISRHPRPVDARSWPELGAAERARLAHLAADFCDTQRVLDGLAQLGAEHPVAVFHLAGTVSALSVAEADLDAVRAAQHAKLDAGDTLRALSQRCPDALIVGVSSILSELSLPRMATYASANRGLEAQLAELAQQGARTLSLALGPFEAVGMNREQDSQEALRARGFELLHPDQLWQALQLALHHRQERLLFGAPAPQLLAAAAAPGQPLTEVSAALLARLAAAFGRELQPSDVDRTFFDLGADSLRLKRLRQGLREELGADVAMADLYRWGTPRQLAAALQRHAPRGAAGGRGAGALLQLRAGAAAAAPAILMLPPAGGALAPYERLTARLPQDIACWGFEDPLLHGGGADWSLTGLISSWADQVVERFATPPAVVGYSAGGYLAWALVEALNARGFEPPLLTLIDSYLIGPPDALGAAIHHVGLASDSRAVGVVVRGLCRLLSSLRVPLARGAHEAWAGSAIMRNSTLQCLFETQRMHHGWQRGLPDAPLPASFGEALDRVSEAAVSNDADLDVERFRRICTHACVLHPQRMVACSPARLANRLALFEVDKHGPTVRDLLGGRASRLVAHEFVPVPSSAQVSRDYFAFSASEVLTKHYICMYDDSFVGHVAQRLQELVRHVA